MDTTNETPDRRVTEPAPRRLEEGERQVTMFNRKAVVVLAGIGAMTVMVVSFAFNTPKQSAAANYGELIPAEQASGEAVRRNYLTSPPDTGHAGTVAASMSPGAPAGVITTDVGVDPYAAGGAGMDMTMAGAYDPYAGSAYAAYAEPAPAATVAEPPKPSARELAFQRAMRCGIRSCPAEEHRVALELSSAEGYQDTGVMQPIQSLAAGSGPPGRATSTAPLNRHEAFLRSAADADASPFIASQVQRPVSPYQIMAGTLIPVTLVTALNSDLPGEVVAHVTRNVYDTQQRHLLIPAGSKVLGKVDNQVGLGQARVNIVWHRIVFPNNNSLKLPGFGGVDGQGAAGIRDRVNTHYGRTYLNALLLSAITAGAQLSQPQPANVYAPPSAGQVAAGALGQQMGEVSSEMIRRNMQVGPTLEVRPGFKFSIYVSKDLVLEPYDRYETH